MTSHKQSQPSSNRSAGNGRSKDDCNFNETDRAILHEINNSMKEMKSEMLALKLKLSETKMELSHVKCENEKLKQTINLNIFKVDELEQYGRRENLRIHGVAHSNGKADDGEEFLIKIADELDINLVENDVQRVHRLGKKPRLTMNVHSQQKMKSRPIIARFISYKKRNEFDFAKAKLKNNELIPGVYLMEDLTPLRKRLLNYVKTQCDDQFVMCHTINGKFV